MTTPERGLFERIEAILKTPLKDIQGDEIVDALQEACTDHDKRLADAEDKLKILEAVKAYDEAGDDAEFEPPHPIFRLAEENDRLRAKLDEGLRLIIEPFEQRLAEAECHASAYKTSVASVVSLHGQLDLAAAEMVHLRARVAELEGQLIAAERAIGDHHPPNDCYATGPSTGDPYKDLVECPACIFLDMRKAALTAPAAKESGQ